MNYKTAKLFLIPVIFFAVFLGFGNEAKAQQHQLEQDMIATLDAIALDTNITSDPNFTVLLKTQDGRTFTYSHGQSSPTDSYESASTSKLPAAVIILTLIDQGYLLLDSKPHDLIDFWTGESSVTLEHLLSFRSGFNGEPAIGQYSDYAACIQAYYNSAIGNQSTPGTQFYYASSHLQIAGLMAIETTGKTWAQLFSDFKTQTGLFPNSQFDIPRTSNPRLAGGMHWTGNDYLAFLEALYQNQRPKDNQPLLSQNMWNALFADHRNSATVINSPIWQRLQEDWSYGLGNWLECPTATSPNSFNCGSGHRNSSPGAYGAYPFIDFDHSYFGIVARQGELGTFHEGVNIFRAIQIQAQEWAQTDTTPPAAPAGLQVN